MAIELHHLHPSHDDELTRLKERIAELERMDTEHTLQIVKLKDKCNMHDFFWEGCGFAKRGFKNSIAVSEAYDFLEEENSYLKESLTVYQRNEKNDIHELRHQKYKRCLAMAKLCHNESLWWYSKGYGFEKYDKFWEKWEKRWLELAEKFKGVGK